MSSKEADDLYRQLPGQLQKAMDPAKEKGASTWLTALPLKEHGFSLHRAAFHDAMALRTDGLPQISRPSATAATISLLNMHSHVPKEVFHPSGTTKSVILRPISSQKCVVRCALNPTCSQLRQTNCLEPLPIHMMGRGLMSQQTECGVGDLKRHFLLCESSTATPPLTRTRHLPPATESMRRRKNEFMNRGYVKWSTGLLLHLFSRPQEEWGERLLVSINAWPPCSFRSGIILTPPHSGG